MSAASVIVFWRMGLRPAVTLGIVSGILNLVPFVVLVLALAVPLVAGLVQFHGTSQVLMVIAVVVLLHLITENLLLPRFVGSRLDVGPVAATVGLLFWGLAVGSCRNSSRGSAYGGNEAARGFGSSTGPLV